MRLDRSVLIAAPRAGFASIRAREFSVRRFAHGADVFAGHALTVIIAGIFDEKWLLEIGAVVNEPVRALETTPRT